MRLNEHETFLTMQEQTNPDRPSFDHLVNLVGRDEPAFAGNLPGDEIHDRVLACTPGLDFKFKNPLYAIESTTIALSLDGLQLDPLSEASFRD